MTYYVHIYLFYCSTKYRPHCIARKLVGWGEKFWRKKGIRFDWRRHLFTEYNHIYFQFHPLIKFRTFLPLGSVGFLFDPGSELNSSEWSVSPAQKIARLTDVQDPFSDNRHLVTSQENRYHLKQTVGSVIGIQDPFSDYRHLVFSQEKFITWREIPWGLSPSIRNYLT